jgi:hypothetical protein
MHADECLNFLIDACRGIFLKEMGADCMLCKALVDAQANLRKDAPT